MRRWTLRILTAVSLLLAIGFVAFWVIRYRNLDGMRFYAGDHLLSISTFEGSLFITMMGAAAGGDAPAYLASRAWLSIPTRWQYSYPDPRKQRIAVPVTEHRWFIFGYGDPQVTGENARLKTISEQRQEDIATVDAQQDGSSPTTRIAAAQAALAARLRSKQIQLPLWFLAAVFAILPAVQLLQYLRRNRPFAAGLCANCGYDLRATPERCPECGQATAAAPG